MREIKFRAWDSEDKAMTTMDSFDFYEDEPNHNEKVGQFFNWHYGCKIMQFTGLKDKNGVEIYEGDIVKHSVHNVTEPILKQILYFEGSFIAKPSYDGSQSYMALINFAPCRTMEVIGNIYENTELLDSNS